MARIDLVEPYAVRLARQNIRDSLMSHGEECLLFHMYHVNEVPPDQPRCPVCFDDLYKGPEKFDCLQCYGTTYDGGVAEVYRAWAIFTDTQDVENQSRRGLWHPQDREIQTEHIPDLWQRDFVCRVSEWSLDHRPLEIEGFYVCKDMSNESLRTGNRSGQTSFDSIAQGGELQHIADEMPITRYPIIGIPFARYDGNAR